MTRPLVVSPYQLAHVAGCSLLFSFMFYFWFASPLLRIQKSYGYLKTLPCCKVRNRTLCSSKTKIDGNHQVFYTVVV